METLDTTPKNNPSAFQFALKWAVILALVEIAFNLVLYVTDNFANRGIGAILYLLMAVVGFVGIKNFRDKELGGYITFGKGFSVSFQVIFYAGIVTAIYTYIFFKFIDHSMIGHIRQIAEQQMLDKGMTEEQVDGAMKFANMFMTPGMFAVTGLFGSALVGAIISLIIGAIMRKENTQLLPPQ